MPDARKAGRKLVSLVARYRSPTIFEFVDEECYDLSPGGMFVKSSHPAPAGTLLKIECHVDQGQPKIKGVARVVWIREREQAGAPAGMGVKFIKLEPGSTETIDSILGQVASAGEAAAAAPALQSDAETSQALGEGRPPRPDESLSQAEVQAAEPVEAAEQPESAQQAEAATQPEAAEQPESAQQAEAATQPEAAEQPEAAQQAEAAQQPEAATQPQAVEPQPVPYGQPEPQQEAVQVQSKSDALAEEQLTQEVGDTIPGVGPSFAVAAARAAETVETPVSQARADASVQPQPEQPVSAEMGDATRPTERVEVSLPQPQGGTPIQPQPRPIPPPPRPRMPALKVSAPPEPRASASLISGRTVMVAMLAIGGLFVVFAFLQRPRGQPAKDETAGQPTDREELAASNVESAPEPDLSSSSQEPAAEPATQEGVQPAPPPEPVEEVAPEPPAPEQPAQYVLDITTTPRGATVTVGNRRITAPGKLSLGQLEGPVELVATKQGFESTVTTVEPSGFEPKGGVMKRHIALVLEPKPAPPPASPAPEKGVPKKAPAPEKAASKKAPAPEKAAGPPKRLDTAPAPPAEAAAGDKAVARAPEEPKPSDETPMQKATACLAKGDNACVIEALKGARTNKELGLLIETYRAIGDEARARGAMKKFVERFPSDRRARLYQKLLERPE